MQQPSQPPPLSPEPLSEDVHAEQDAADESPHEGASACATPLAEVGNMLENLGEAIESSAKKPTAIRKTLETFANKRTMAPRD